jgi:hypothetical protein
MPQVDLDKTLRGAMDSFGTLQMRVIVLKPRPKTTEGGPEAATDRIGEADEDAASDTTVTPVATYLERSRHGKQCIVFLVNGQRHEGWDNSFIARNLGFKYLRSRTIIAVDLDGLAPEAIAEIVQGSRQGLYAGNVLAAISDRLIATLKSDPDLLRLQAEAEQEIAELQAGDEVVRTQLDELIEAHHAHGEHKGTGSVESDGEVTATGAFGKDIRQEIVTADRAAIGEPAAFPVLASIPDTMKIRLRPGAERTLTIKALPSSRWAELEDLRVRCVPAIEELATHVSREQGAAEIWLKFREPADVDADYYPLITSLQVFATFKGYPEPRLLQRELIINPKVPPPPKPLPVLLTTPTVLNVVSRQPVKLISGGPSTHVRLRWDGEDRLVSGAQPAWRFQGRCLTIGTFPEIAFTSPQGGRFEALLDTPRGLLPEQQLEFEIQALGPSGGQLPARFHGVIAEEPQGIAPRSVELKAPEVLSQRRPPYQLKYVEEATWVTPTCWGESEWNEDDAGAFTEPTESAPLTLIINVDFAGLKAFRDELLRRKLEESTIRERNTRYTSHVAFHLYQMYEFQRSQRDASSTDPDIHIPDDRDLRLEIQRVATTLLRLMEVSR